MRRDDGKCEPDNTSAFWSHTTDGQLVQTFKKGAGMCEYKLFNVYVWVM